MFPKTRNFIKTTLLGGLLVILPTAIVALIFGWLFVRLLDIIRPLTKLLQTGAGMRDFLANTAALGVVVGVCFIIGLVVQTRFGKWFYATIENRILSRVPTYSLIRETILQFSGAKQFPFSSVAMVRLYGSDVLTNGFIMNTHDSGYQTVFVPTGPNPTSGMIYHLPPKDVFPVDVDVQETMRVIFNCGGGSNQLIDSFIQKHSPNEKKETSVQDDTDSPKTCTENNGGERSDKKQETKECSRH